MHARSPAHARTPAAHQASGESSHAGRAVLHDFCMTIPYSAGALVCALVAAVVKVPAVGVLLAGAGAIIALCSVLSLKTWKAGGSSTPYTLVSAGALAGLLRPLLGWRSSGTSLDPWCVHPPTHTHTRRRLWLGCVRDVAARGGRRHTRALWHRPGRVCSIGAVLRLQRAGRRQPSAVGAQGSLAALGRELSAR